MNINKLFLLSIFTLSIATIRPNEFIAQEVTQSVAAPDETSNTSTNRFWGNDYISKTIMPGILAGGFTGTAIGYLSGKLFDGMLNKNVVRALAQSCGEKIPVTAIVALARIGAQVGSKWYWEKPLRHKIMNWLQNDMKQDGVEFNEELMKTIARVTAWLGFTTQISTGYFPYNLLNTIIIR